MESLPNELWLLVYHYLSHIDILYSFKNLNSRFNNLITSYSQNINLIDVSYEIMEEFVHDILPSFSHCITSLIVKHTDQIALCDKNHVFRSISNLKYLMIIVNCKHDWALGDFFAYHYSDLHQLIKFCIEGSFAPYETIYYINRFPPSSLTNLILRPYKPQGDGQLKISNLRSLKVNLLNVNVLFRLITSLKNLEELYLAVQDWLQPLPELEERFPLPTSITKLHLEFGRSILAIHGTGFDSMKNFFLHFQKQLQSLTLIVTSTHPAFADFHQLQSIERSLLTLTLFEYLIRTTHCPSNGFDHIEHLPDDTYLLYTTKPRRPVRFAR